MLLGRHWPDTCFSLRIMNFVHRLDFGILPVQSTVELYFLLPFYYFGFFFFLINDQYVKFLAKRGPKEFLVFKNVSLILY